MLVRFADAASAATTYQYLKTNGIFCRPMGTYGLDDCLRFTIGTGEEMQKVTTALLNCAPAGDRKN
ncbi:MAG: hypothetical protein FJX52_17245 [Alphaproteobacteria bacterium]|nr:hypothetical protein [Alphaproteobacteria bacterium]